MKSPYRFLRALGPALATLMLCACGGDVSPQQRAYEQALQMEEQYSLETAPAILTEYRKTIAMEAGTRWAELAQARIDAVEAQMKADEQHKDIFHEHGID